MYADMSWTVKGLVRSLLRRGVAPEELVRDGKPLPKRELVDLENDYVCLEERATFARHMAWVSGR